MKKIVSLVLALVLVLALASTALAASVRATYNDGVISVSGSVDDARSYSVLIDGGQTGVAISQANTSVTVSKTLSAGTHTVSLYNDMAGTVATNSFTVGGEAPATEAPATEAPVTAAPVTAAPVTAEPTAIPAPTEIPVGPVKVTSASYKNGVITFSVSGLTAAAAEVWVDGESVPVNVRGNGTFTFSKRLSVGSHKLTVYVGANGESSTKTFEVVLTKPTIIASYPAVGSLVVTVTNLNNPAEIWVDGAAIALNVKTDGTYTGNVKLAEGTHTVMVYDAVNNLSATTSLTVGHIWRTIPGKAATCTEAGYTDSKVCEICGLTEDPVEIAALGHNYKVVDKTPTKLTYKCTRCGDKFTADNNSTVKSAYGSIVKDATGIAVDYTAAASKADAKTLVIVADLSKAGITTELGLYLDDALLAQLKREGFTAVNFINGDASIVIELDAIKAGWFNTSNAIWCYVFSTDPAAEGGILVKVEAQISGTEKVLADAFEGVTLKKVSGDVAVTANGIY